MLNFVANQNITTEIWGAGCPLSICGALLLVSTAEGKAVIQVRLRKGYAKIPWLTTSCLTYLSRLNCHLDNFGAFGMGLNTKKPSSDLHFFANAYGIWMVVWQPTKLLVNSVYHTQLMKVKPYQYMNRAIPTIQYRQEIGGPYAQAPACQLMGIHGHSPIVHGFCRRKNGFKRPTSSQCIRL